MGPYAITSGERKLIPTMPFFLNQVNPDYTLAFHVALFMGRGYRMDGAEGGLCPTLIHQVGTKTCGYSGVITMGVEILLYCEPAGLLAPM